MRAHEFITEEANQNFEKNISVEQKFGGGKIQIKFQKLGNKLNYTHSIYFDSSGKEQIKYVMQDKKQTWYDSSFPRGQSFHENTPPNELFTKFFNSCAKIMSENFGQKILSHDPSGQRTIELSKRLGRDVMETQNNVDIQNEIFTALKPAMDLLAWGIQNMGKEVHEWPAVMESKTGKPELPNTYVLPSIKNNDPYEILRLGVAIAGARSGKHLEKSSDVGENVGIVSYGEDTGKLIDKAMSDIGKKGRVKKGGAKPEAKGDVKSLMPGFRSW